MDLYSDLATQFSDSRNYFQPGWDYLAKLDLPQKLSVLDFGCGDGRFNKFLNQTFPTKQITYTGVDKSSELLKIAAKSSAQNLFQAELPNIPRPTYEDIEAKGPFELITIYALMHHLYSFDDRLKLLNLASELLSENGFLHVSFWQFGEYERYKHKLSKDLKLLPADEQKVIALEEHDYVMDWQRGGTAYRFCHWTALPEIEKLETQSKLKRINSYRSDGKEGDQNWYFLWQK